MQELRLEDIQLSENAIKGFIKESKKLVSAMLEKGVKLKLIRDEYFVIDDDGTGFLCVDFQHRKVRFQLDETDWVIRPAFISIRSMI